MKKSERNTTLPKIAAEFSKIGLSYPNNKLGNVAVVQEGLGARVLDEENFADYIKRAISATALQVRAIQCIDMHTYIYAYI